MPNKQADFLRQLLAARTTLDVEAIMAALPIVDPEQYQWTSSTAPSGAWKPGHLHWVPVGRDRGNSGRIKLAGEPMNPLAERLVNGMEAIIELKRIAEVQRDSTAAMPPSPREAVQRYFSLPRLDTIERLDTDERKVVRARVNDVRKLLRIRLDHDKKTKQFAVTIRDEGMGQTPARMHETLLSLGQSDKGDKPYLIGVFGQGGSSALSVSTYSIIVTRRNSSILKEGEDAGAGWTIVRNIHPRGRRDPYYAYLAASEDGAVPRVDAKAAAEAGFEHGAHFRHIKYDFGGSESAVSRLLYQALNHALFNPILPYDLYAMKDKPEPMLGTAQRLARQVRLSGPQNSLDKSFVEQPVP